MAERALVTGGAGFIGSHIVDGLLEGGYEVLVYDSLVEQVHGPGATRPSYLADVELVQADIRDRDALTAAIHRADVVLHEASAVGVGQSMYDIESYVSVNSLGTALLCELLSKGGHSVRKVLVASSMSNYGEGAYECDEHGIQSPRTRPLEQLQDRRWELGCPQCGAPLRPLPTDEDKPMQPTSVYATTKRDQEELVLNVCGAYDIPAVALRYFNIYGPRQALSNPYTGVAAIFSSRIKNGSPPLVFEDGLQSRDFTDVRDVARANLLALERGEADGMVVNIGTGRPTTMLELIDLLSRHLGRDDLQPEILGSFREGDIRHCYADITRARTLLGFEPSVRFEDGVSQLVSWIDDQPADDHVDRAFAELKERGLVR